jgi:hypothetical protein
MHQIIGIAREVVMVVSKLVLRKQNNISIVTINQEFFQIDQVNNKCSKKDLDRAISKIVMIASVRVVVAIIIIAEVTRIIEDRAVKRNLAEKTGTLKEAVNGVTTGEIIIRVSLKACEIRKLKLQIKLLFILDWNNQWNQNQYGGSSNSSTDNSGDTNQQWMAYYQVR